MPNWVKNWYDRHRRRRLAHSISIIPWLRLKLKSQLHQNRRDFLVDCEIFFLQTQALWRQLEFQQRRQWYHFLSKMFIQHHHHKMRVPEMELYIMAMQIIQFNWHRRPRQRCVASTTFLRCHRRVAQTIVWLTGPITATILIMAYDIQRHTMPGQTTVVMVAVYPIYHQWLHRLNTHHTRCQHQNQCQISTILVDIIIIIIIIIKKLERHWPRMPNLKRWRKAYSKKVLQIFSHR